MKYNFEEIKILDDFAGKALPEVMKKAIHSDEDEQWVARVSYSFAEAMMEERKKYL